ncbi:tetratricopeptide repeat protein [Alphaproteobacteria bacterium]|nr:tetratricopeptide repeat protein [Alphaproteobacteria bacterium]
MVSKVFLYKSRKFLIVGFLIISISLFAQILKADDYKFKKSYYGSILSGQIANYNNDSSASADFFNFAHTINPNNNEVYQLSLMSLILSGNIESAISTVKNYRKKFNSQTDDTVVSNFLIFIDEVKNNNFQKALQHLNNSKSFLITDKMIPILKSWLSPSLEEATSNLNKYEYKSKGLALSNIYFLHLALIEYFYNDKASSKKTFEKHLEVFEIEKLRALYFYNILFGKNDKENKYISLFLQKYSEHSFSVYLKRNNNTFRNFTSPKSGISEALYNLAQTLFSQNMYETSLALAQTSLYLDKDNYLAKYLISLNLNNLNKKKLSLEYLKRIPSSSYISWNADLTIAELYLDLKEYKSASEYLLKLQNNYPKKTEILYRLGELYHIQKNYNNAIKYFSEAISSIKTIENKYWYLYYSRGMAYERANKWEKAEKDFLYSIELSPEQPLTLNYLGYSWIDSGKNIDEAKKLISKAVKLRPNDGYFVDSLGWAYYRMGEYKKAVLELEKAVSLVPNDPIINDHLGDAMWRAGYKNEAVFQWNRALIYKPDNELKEKIKFKLQKGL